MKGLKAMMGIDAFPARCRNINELGRCPQFVKIVVLAATILPLLAVSPAPAQTAKSCGPREELVASLGGKFREQPSWMGISNQGVLTQLLTSDNGRTWTILIIQPDGRACVVDAGEGSEHLDRLDYPTFGDGA